MTAIDIQEEELNQEEQVQPTAYERMQANITKAKASAERIMTKALEDRSLIEEMDIGLEELANDLEGKESELFGTQKEVEEEVEEEVLTKLDENPHSPTHGQQIPIV